MKHTNYHELSRIITNFAAKVSHKAIQGYVNIAKICAFNRVIVSFVTHNRSFIENDHRIWCFT